MQPPPWSTVLVAVLAALVLASRVEALHGSKTDSPKRTGRPLPPAYQEYYHWCRKIVDMEDWPLEFKMTPKKGLSAFAKRKIMASEEIISVKWENTLRLQDVADIFPFLPKYFEAIAAWPQMVGAEDVPFALAVMYHHLHTDAHLHTWARMLTPSNSHHLPFTDAEGVLQAQLEGIATIDSTARTLALAQKVVANAHRLLSLNWGPEIHSQLGDFFTKDNLVAYTAHVFSRIWRHHGSEGTHSFEGLVPCVDAINHCWDSARVEYGTHAMSIHAAFESPKRAFRKGEEVCIPYADVSTPAMFLQWGFVPESHPRFDALSINVTDHLDLGEIGKYLQTKHPTMAYPVTVGLHDAAAAVRPAVRLAIIARLKEKKASATDFAVVDEWVRAAHAPFEDAKAELSVYQGVCQVLKKAYDSAIKDANEEDERKWLAANKKASAPLILAHHYKMDRKKFALHVLKRAEEAYQSLLAPTNKQEL